VPCVLHCCRLGCAARRAPRRLGVRCGPIPTASRSGPLVPIAPAILGTRAHLRTVSYGRRHLMPTVRRPTPAARVHRGSSPYCGVTLGSYSDAQPRSRPAIKVARGAERRLLVTVRHWRLHGKLALLLFSATVWHPCRLH
jgi:hypothetical protein